MAIVLHSLYRVVFPFVLTLIYLLKKTESRLRISVLHFFLFQQKYSLWILWTLVVILQIFTQILLRKPQIEEDCVHILQSAYTSADFFDNLSQIAGDGSNKDSLERNLYLSLLRCVVARRRKETTQLINATMARCLGVLVPQSCLT